jgi:hypothetical protein
MSDTLIQILSEAFDRAINSALDARMTAVMQQYNNAIGQFVTDIDIDALKHRVAALELRLPVESVNKEKLEELVGEAVDKALEDHNSTYDHDRYDTVASDFEDLNTDDFVTSDSMESEVRSVLRNASVSLDLN